MPRLSPPPCVSLSSILPSEFLHSEACHVRPAMRTRTAGPGRAFYLNRLFPAEIIPPPQGAQRVTYNRRKAAKPEKAPTYDQERARYVLDKQQPLDQCGRCGR